MEVLILLILVAVILMLFRLNNMLAARLEALESELAAIRKAIVSGAAKQDVLRESSTATPQAPTEKQPEQDWQSGFKVVEETKIPAAQPIQPEAPLMRIEEPEPQRIKQNAPPDPTIKQPAPSFLERHPDLERFIGENITSKIGIGILVLAIGFFVKYAIDNQWIGETARVAIGLLCGGILTGLAHRMRNSYAAFSSVLVGGGLAIFYFTITLAYHEYHLFSQTVTFIIMVGITAFAVVLSQLYNRQELAVIALIGGFATPFMASSGNNNYQALFIYLIILNAGLLVIAYFKAWRILNLLAFIFTVILFASWLYTLPYQPPVVIWKHALIFGSIFYLLFIFINLAHNIRENKRFLASDFCTILSNTCLYFALGIYCINEMEAEIYRGLFTASLAVFNLVISIILYQNRKTDPNILYLLIGITVSLVSLTAPVQLEGNNITLFWATEVVLLYWLFQKSRIRIMQLASLIVWLALLVSILMDWVEFYGQTSFHRFLINKGFVTNVFAAVSCLAVFYLRKKDELSSEMNSIRGFPKANIFFLTAMVLFYAAGFAEIWYNFDYHYPSVDINGLYLVAYTLAFVILFRWLVARYTSLHANNTIALILAGFALMLQLASLPLVFAAQEDMLKTSQNQGHFVAHWIAAALTSVIIYQLITSLRKVNSAQLYKTLVWLMCAYIVIFLSTELLLAVNMIFYSAALPLNEIERIYVKTVLPILWGVCSFAYMWLGMKYKFRTLRIISLSLFTLTLAKLFLFDIRHIPVAGKIAAFFCLGVLLLIISFMYQRVKKIIVEEQEL
jgi:uncharacterized membrane protein